jgi:hypothetical protein
VDAAAELDATYAMTGGGADCASDANGTPIYLTASYPYSTDDPRDGSFSSNTWRVAGKDAFVAAAAPITAYAVGVKWSTTFLNGFGAQPPIIAECLCLDSPNSPHPEAAVGPPDQTMLVGGGAYDRWHGSDGNMLTDSYPEDIATWHAAGKDHIASSPATLTVYAIGLKNLAAPPSKA